MRNIFVFLLLLVSFTATAADSTAAPPVTGAEPVTRGATITVTATTTVANTEPSASSSTTAQETVVETQPTSTTGPDVEPTSTTTNETLPTTITTVLETVPTSTNGPTSNETQLTSTSALETQPTSTGPEFVTTTTTATIYPDGMLSFLNYDTSICSTCSATIGNTFYSSCGEVTQAVVRGDISCDEVYDSSCGCCGLCDFTGPGLAAQHDMYSACPTPGQVNAKCSFCTGSEYERLNEVVRYGCVDEPRSADTGICLSFFLGIYGAGYYYYGYSAAAICMTVFGIIWLAITIAGCCGVGVLGIVGGVFKGIWFCWGFIMFCMVAVTTLLPNYNEYGIYCPMKCRSDGYMPQGDGVYLPAGDMSPFEDPNYAADANMCSLATAAAAVCISTIIVSRR